jgi:hypothetical protein
MKSRFTTQQFIEKSQLVHDDLYGYELVRYIKNSDKVDIVCKTHGVFSQRAASHLAGAGCPGCAGNNLDDNDGFTRKCMTVHRDLYDYSLVDYKGLKTKVSIVCRQHGTFLQRPDMHLRGQGCPICNPPISKNTHTFDTFIKKSKLVHGDLYGYELVDYVNNNTKVRLICKTHGTFDQRPAGHMRGEGCPNCGGCYNKSIPGTLYYVRFDLPGLTLWKIGITNRTVQSRFRGFAVKPVILEKWRWDDGSIAAREERRILRGGLYDDYRYTGEPLLENGNTECFTIDIMQLGNEPFIKLTA